MRISVTGDMVITITATKASGGGIGIFSLPTSDIAMIEQSTEIVVYKDDSQILEVYKNEKEN